MSNIEKLPIYFNDLNEEAREKFLKFQSCQQPSDGNWDVNIHPITILEVEKPAIQIYSICELGIIDDMEELKRLDYLAAVDFEFIDHHHPAHQIKICQKEISNPNFKVFTLNPFVIQWAVDHCVPVMNYYTDSVWSRDDYAAFYESLKTLPVSLSLPKSEDDI